MLGIQKDDSEDIEGVHSGVVGVTGVDLSKTDQVLDRDVEKILVICHYR